jgi:hypothetical protein
MTILPTYFALVILEIGSHFLLRTWMEILLILLSTVAEMTGMGHYIQRFLLKRFLPRLALSSSSPGLHLSCS